MTDYHIRLTEQAKNDITDIGDYISFSLLEPDISHNFIKGLRNSISQLKFFPYKFPLIHNDILQHPNIRCMPYKDYYIFYEVLDSISAIIILRIGYKRRNWSDLLF